MSQSSAALILSEGRLRGVKWLVRAGSTSSPPWSGIFQKEISKHNYSSQEIPDNGFHHRWFHVTEKSGKTIDSWVPEEALSATAVNPIIAYFEVPLGREKEVAADICMLAERDDGEQFIIGDGFSLSEMQAMFEDSTDDCG